MTIVETIDLTKSYGPLTAVNQLSIRVLKGQVYGILGPNGSGKTTTLGMLSGVINPTSGSYTWFGESHSAALRKRVGMILEKPNFYPYMSATNNLEIVAKIKGVTQKSRIDQVLRLVGLHHRKDDRFSTFSLGMKQRLSIASAMLSDPEVLVLDEPTNGLDPQGIAEIRELTLNLAETGKTIILASHLLDEVQKVCTHFLVMKQGKIMHQGSVADASGTQSVVELGSERKDELIAALKSIEWVSNTQTDGELVSVNLTGERRANDLNEALIGKGVVLSHLVQRKFNLEEKFLQILSNDV